MLLFWLAVTLVFITVTVCSTINLSLHNALVHLIPWLETTFTDELREAGNLDDIRDIKKTRIPLLEDWYLGSRWYGIVVFVLQIMLIIVAGLVQFFHVVPYILVMVTIMLLGSILFYFTWLHFMLLGSTLMFFPRTWIRRKHVFTARSFYFLAHVALLTKTKLDEIENSYANKPTGTGADSHG